MAATPARTRAGSRRKCSVSSAKRRLKSAITGASGDWASGGHSFCQRSVERSREHNQSFPAGTGQFCVPPVPKGRLNPSSAGRVPFRRALGRPFGTWGRLTAKPSVETLGYYSECPLRTRTAGRAEGIPRKPYIEYEKSPQESS